MDIVETSIPGLQEIRLDVFSDERGSFREAYQAAKLKDLGTPPLDIVQMNVSESEYGVIRGIHAEPWDKYIHVTYGEVFAAIVDLRRDVESFGQVATFTLNTSNALLVPQGLGNSFAVTTERAVYSYLVTEHWRADNPYPAVSYDDPALAIPWPIDPEKRIVSEKDRTNPTLQDAYGAA